MRTLLTLALTASALVAAPAYAQQMDPAAPPPPGAPMRDGMGREPGGGMGGGGMAGMLMRADLNHDGIVTREEVIASADQMFDRLDMNRDGAVTRDEMAAMRPEGTAPRGDMGATPPPPPPPGAASAGLSRQQWHDRALRQFDRVDANHDGKVDRTEIANYQEAMRERRMERRDGQMPPPPAGQAQ